MMERCKNCRRKPGIEKRVNGEGVLFCSDDCYEEYGESANDYDHPYIEDYDAVRFEYMEWMQNYERDLHEGRLNEVSKKEELIENIDALIDEFYDNYRLEGSDGFFSTEIYNYLLNFKKLKSLIINWQAKEKAPIKR